MRLPLALCLGALLCSWVPAQRPTGTTGVVVAGAVENGLWRLDRLGLGDGGLGSAPGVDGRLPLGQYVTPGGVLVRAQREGVKLDFPSGAELLISPDGVVHARDGERTGISLHVVEVWLADGSRVRAVRASGGRRPFQQVHVVRDGEARLLWRRGRTYSARESSIVASGTCYAALGRGNTLYQMARLGPILTLRRALCPRVDQVEMPRKWVAVCGDLLSDSLQMLPGHVPPHTVQFPQAPEAAKTLSAAAPALFSEQPNWRPAGAAGELVFSLRGGFRLEIELRDGDQLWACLYRGAAGLPVVEWKAGPRTSLHLVRPQGGINGSPRYFLRGIDLSEAVRELLPLPTNAVTQRVALRTLRELGVRPPRERVVPASMSRR